MISRLIKNRNGTYICENCRMPVPDDPIPSNCVFCGDYFDNWEVMMFDENKLKTIGEVKEKENEK